MSSTASGQQKWNWQSRDDKLSWTWRWDCTTEINLGSLSVQASWTTLTAKMKKTPPRIMTLMRIFRWAFYSQEYKEWQYNGQSRGKSHRQWLRFDDLSKRSWFVVEQYNQPILPPDRRGRGWRIRREEGEIFLAIQCAVQGAQGAGNTLEHFNAMFLSAWFDEVFHPCVFQKLSVDTTIHDPHKLTEIIDPVFSDNVSVHGIKHRLATK